MEISECPQCERLRNVYRRATRNELDMMIMRDEAEMRRDSARFKELTAMLAVATEVRASACKGILDHEQTHGRNGATAGKGKSRSARVG